MFSDPSETDLTRYPSIADLPDDIFNMYQLAKLLVDIQNTSVDDVLLEKDKPKDD